MRIAVRYLNDEKTVELDNATVEKALKAAGIGTQMVIAKVNGSIVPDSEPLKDGDKIEAIRVVSGG